MSTVTPTLLPCSIEPGTTTFDKKLWDPKIDAAAAVSVKDGAEDSKNPEITAYFRGRRLVGREVQLPEGCKGVIVENTGLLASQRANMSAAKAGDKDSDSKLDVIDLVDDDDDDNTSGRLKTGGDGDSELTLLPLPRLDAAHEFRSIRVLGHEQAPARDLPALQAVSEWIALARAIHHPLDRLP